MGVMERTADLSALEAEITAVGCTQVMVMLADTAAASHIADPAVALAGNFLTEDDEPNFALMAGLGASVEKAFGIRKSRRLMRYFPHLGICLGTVNREGLAGLQRMAAVADVQAAPVISLIRPTAAVAATGLAAGPT